MEGADVFFGLSAKGAVTQDMVKSMAPKPIIFAMANPDPEITPEEVKAVRADAIVATGRSDYANQVNNVLGFPYIFRGALDVRARTINDQMKIAAAEALAALARQDVPDEVDAAYAGRRLRFGPEYIIPVPFDPRLISAIPAAVAKAAMDSGVARRPIIDMEDYKATLAARLDPAAASMHLIFERLHLNPRRVVFAEGEEERVIRAALAYRAAGYGTPVLIGRTERIHDTIKQSGLGEAAGLEIVNAANSQHTKQYHEMLYAKLQRHGSLLRDVNRMVNQDRNVFGACMVEAGHADAMVTGTTRSFAVCLEDVLRVDRRARAPDPDGDLGGGGARPHGADRRYLGARAADGGAAGGLRRRNRPRWRASWGTSRGSRSSPSPISATRRAKRPSASAKRSR